MLPSNPFPVNFVLSDDFGEYLSKSFGNWTTGCFISFRLPLPLITTRNVTGSLAVTIFLFNELEMENVPTPPENPAGRVGKGNTLTLTEGATIFLFTSMYPEPPLKKASNGSTFVFSCTIMPLNVIDGISNFPVI